MGLRLGFRSLSIFAQRRKPPRLRQLIRLIWQAGTVAWIGGGVLLIAAPSMASEPARHWIIVTLAIVFGFAALANAWAMRGPQLHTARQLSKSCPPDNQIPPGVPLAG